MKREQKVRRRTEQDATECDGKGHSDGISGNRDGGSLVTVKACIVSVFWDFTGSGPKVNGL